MPADDEIQSKIRTFMHCVDENRKCFDCGESGTTYINVTIGSFVCSSCSGLLRRLNHRLKSINMSTFNENELQLLMRRGNKVIRTCIDLIVFKLLKIVYYATCPELKPPEEDISRETFLTQKYEQKKWYREPVPELEEQNYWDTKKLIETQMQKCKNNEKDSRTRFMPKQTTKTVFKQESLPALTRTSSIPNAVVKELPVMNFAAFPPPIVSSPTRWEQPPLRTAPVVQQQPVENPFSWPSTFDSHSFVTASPKEESAKATPMQVMDKYAALAELDSLFKSSSTTSPDRSSSLNEMQFPVEQKRSFSTTNPFLVAAPTSVSGNSALPADVDADLSKIFTLRKSTGLQRPNGTVSAMDAPFLTPDTDPFSSLNPFEDFLGTAIKQEEPKSAPLEDPFPPFAPF
ncbi:ArfGAP with FG repeats 1 [Cichlidogyrus casuarinus]|uniref:ArfGAP with FG repeats 1 n=1 Tax=Cichlidogyrus casuarinus TaxID=1844966 RepID=A0ABD2PXH5_9PLAT